MDDRFKHHAPAPDTQRQHEAAREAANAFFEAIELIAPGSREKSLAVTKTEEAMFWLNAAIARNQ